MARGEKKKESKGKKPKDKANDKMDQVDGAGAPAAFKSGGQVRAGIPKGRK